MPEEVEEGRKFEYVCALCVGFVGDLWVSLRFLA